MGSGLKPDPVSVKGFENFNSNKSLARLAENKFKGLLPVIFVCMFMEEADLKADNIGLDENGNVVKIDNDAAFASILWSILENYIPSYSNLNKSLQKQFKFSGEDINNPINPTDFNATTWQVRTLFKDNNIFSTENIHEMYDVWKKIISSKPIIFRLIDMIIQSPDLNATLKNLMTKKIEHLTELLNQHSEYKSYMQNNGDEVMKKIKNDAQDFKKNNKKYFTGSNVDLDTALDKAKQEMKF